MAEPYVCPDCRKGNCKKKRRTLCSKDFCVCLHNGAQSRIDSTPNATAARRRSPKLFDQLTPLIAAYPNQNDWRFHLQMALYR